VWVISLGGSRIVPHDVDYHFIERFKELIKSHPSHKFVAVTGGGSTARTYIKALKMLKKSTKDQSMEGIAITRLHANFLSRIFGSMANEELPFNMKKVKNLLLKNKIVFCGGLRYEPENTSDGTASKIAAYLGCPFINLTNVDGLYTADPSKNKNAKRISRISWKKFDAIASKIKYEAGQHFVLDQSASKVIMRDKIPTYIVSSLDSIDRIIRGQTFKGTLIAG